jgi:hypothetical protein
VSGAKSDPVPWLVPGAPAAPRQTSDDWMRSPSCPNNATDCQITVTMTPVTTPPPAAIHDGFGNPQPPLTLRALPHATCKTCSLQWDITRMPAGPNELPPTPYPPPTNPPYP